MIALLIQKVKEHGLLKKDQTYLSEYTDRLTGPQGNLKAQDVTGLPKYHYAMFGGATGTGDTTSGGIYVAPTPDLTYRFRVYVDKVPKSLATQTSGTYVSPVLSTGLIICCSRRSLWVFKGSDGYVDIIRE